MAAPRLPASPPRLTRPLLVTDDDPLVAGGDQGGGRRPASLPSLTISVALTTVPVPPERRSLQRRLCSEVMPARPRWKSAIASPVGSVNVGAAKPAPVTLGSGRREEELRARVLQPEAAHQDGDAPPTIQAQLRPLRR